jgi:tetratricopeptide (TPR) repeat protein
MELDPLSPEPVINAIMALVWQGRFDKALEIARRTVELDPFLGHFAAGWTDVEAGRFNEAISELEQANGPDAPPMECGLLGYAYGAAGRRDRALGVIALFKQRSLRGYVPPFNLALVHAGIGDRGRTLDDLEAALAAKSQWMAFLKMDRVFDPFCREPRFIALLKKVHLYG